MAMLVKKPRLQEMWVCNKDGIGKFRVIEYEGYYVVTEKYNSVLLQPHKALYWKQENYFHPTREVAILNYMGALNQEIAQKLQDISDLETKIENLYGVLESDVE